MLVDLKREQQTKETALDFVVNRFCMKLFSTNLI